MTPPVSPIDERLAAICAAHFDASTPLPAVIDVTGASDAAVESVRALPFVTFERTDAELPPRVSTRADLTIPHGDAGALEAAVQRNPNASLVLTQLVRATADLPVASALTMESIAYSALQAGQEYRTWLNERPAAGDTDDSPRISITDEDGSTVITLTRPERANALDTFARHDLVQALTALAHTDDPLVLRGAGDHFCAGGDLDEFSAPDDITRTHRIRLAQGLPAAVARIGSRLEVEVHGAVIGAGIELSAFARHIVARPNARFRLPEVRMGLLPGSGGTVSVPRRIGANRALLFVLTGRVLKAEQALAWGLVDEISV